MKLIHLADAHLDSKMESKLDKSKASMRRDELLDTFCGIADYADENGVRQFVVDISCNTGGSTGVECYLRGLMTNARNHDNKVTSLSIDMLTKQVTTNIDEIDFNLDGSFDELDKDVAYDFDFSIITSKYSEPPS